MTIVSRLFQAFAVVAFFVFAAPTIATAQPTAQPKCPTDYQPYGNRCVSQGMADYISCVEATGGHQEQLKEEINREKAVAGSGGASGGMKNPAINVRADAVLSRKTEEAVAARFERRWFPGARTECLKALQEAQKPPRKSSGNTKTPSQPTAEKSSPPQSLIKILDVTSSSLFTVSDRKDEFFQPQAIWEPSDIYRPISIRLVIQNLSQERVKLDWIRVTAVQIQPKPLVDFDSLNYSNANVVIIAAGPRISSSEVGFLNPVLGEGSSNRPDGDRFDFRPISFTYRALNLLKESPIQKETFMYPTYPKGIAEKYQTDRLLATGIEVPVEIGLVTRSVPSTVDGQILFFADVRLKFLVTGSLRLKIDLKTDVGLATSKPFTVHLRAS